MDDENPYMEVDTIPKTENLLQKAIRQSRIGQLGATSPVGMLPTTGQEAMDIAKVGIRQLIPESPGFVGVGANIVDPRPSKIELPAPETQYGKNLETSANVAQATHLASSLGSSAGRGIESFVNKFRTGPVKQNIEDLIFNGSKQVDSSLENMFREYNSKFGKSLEGLNSKMTSGDFADVVSSAADEIGNYNKSNELLTDELGDLLKEGDKTYTPQEVQAKSKRILQMLGKDNRAKAVFYKHFMDKLPEAVPGLKELKEAHAPIYQIANEAKSLGKGSLRKAARGNMGPDELNSLKEAQKKLGIDVITPLEEKGNELKKIIMRKKIGKAGLALTGAGAGLISIIKAIGGHSSE
jgi:hypothetical protein